MDNDYIAEKLNSIRNEMSHLWGGAFVTGGGTFTLLSTSLNNLKIAFVIL